MDEDSRDPPETFDDEREHFDVICQVSTEEGETTKADCRDDGGHENDGRLIIDDGDVFVDPLANERFVDVTETRDLPPPEPKQQNTSSIDFPNENPWPSLTTRIGGSFGSFLHRTEASNNIPLSPMDQQVRDHHHNNADDDDDEQYQSFGKASSAGMDSYSYTYSDSSVSEKDNAYADHIAQRRMDIAGEVIRTLSTTDDGGDDISQLKLIAVLGILSSMSEDGALKEEEDDDELKFGDQATDANSFFNEAEGPTTRNAANIINGDDSYSTQVEKAIASRTTITTEKEAATMPPMATTSNKEEAKNQTSVEFKLKELLGLAPDIDYASVVAGWDESVRSQLKDVTEKVSPVISNFMESKEVKGSIDKVAQDITTVLETLDISVNIENLTKLRDSNDGAGVTTRRTKPTPLQTTNTTNEEEVVSGSTSTASHQQAGLRPFIRTKSLSPMSGGGKDSSNENNNDTSNAYVSSSTRSTSNNSFFGGSDDQDGKMQKNGSIKNANTVEDVPCLKPSRFKGGGALLPL